MKKIGVLVGSLRKKSYNKTVAEYLLGRLAENNAAEIIDIASLPLYNPDMDEGEIPENWVNFREKTSGMDAFLIVTPEYNRSFPAAIKNALDIGSRPMGGSVWNAKPCGVVSASPGKLGGFGANNHLRQTLAYLNLYAMPQPEVYLSEVNKSIGREEIIESDATKSFLDKFVQAYQEWIDRLYERRGDII